MRKTLIFFSVLVGILTITFNSAAEEKHGRFYAGAGASYVREYFDDGDLKGLPGNSSIDNSWGFNLFAGYWWLKHVGIEANYNWYDDFDGEAANNRNLDVSIWTAMLDVRVFSPSLWQDRIFPYVRLGGGWMDVEVDASNFNSDESDWAYNVGLGVDVFVAHQLSVGLDGKHVWGTGDVSDFNHMTFTLRAAYHF
ncbi:MAG: porin family protein [Desulfobacterales bacterium]|nr:porin family protein [Desulfobacterales bacterium]